MHFYAKMSPTVDKLVRLARGDIDLVSRAMRAVAVDGVADLGDIVDYIVARRVVR